MPPALTGVRGKVTAITQILEFPSRALPTIWVNLGSWSDKDHKTHGLQDCPVYCEEFGESASGQQKFFDQECDQMGLLSFLPMDSKHRVWEESQLVLGEDAVTYIWSCILLGSLVSHTRSTLPIASGTQSNGCLFVLPLGRHERFPNLVIFSIKPLSLRTLRNAT